MRAYGPKVTKVSGSPTKLGLAAENDEMEGCDNAKERLAVA
jgi:hypothetical protein